MVDDFTLRMVMWGIPMVFGGGVAWGVVKKSMAGYVTHEQLTENCRDRDKELDGKLKEIHNDIKGMIRSIGKIEGRISA